MASTLIYGTTDPAPTRADIEAALAGDAELLVRGPLNDAHAVLLGGRRLFVRRRTLFDPEYGQCFAGERYAYPLLAGRVRVPALLAVVDEGSDASFAVFEFIDNEPIDWEDRQFLDQFVDALATIHGVAGSAPGFLDRPIRTDDLNGYLGGLFAAEVERFGEPGRPPVPLDGLDALLREVLTFDPTDLCLCHGDVHRGNVLRDPNGDLWVIDWEATRFRVAAADFNQMHDQWLSPAQEDWVTSRYCERTGRDLATFRRQVAAFRILGHLRSYNFEVLVRRSAPVTQRAHLEQVAMILGGLS